MIGLNESFQDDPATGEGKPPLVSILETILSNTGSLVTRHGLEHRPQQESMANAVAEAMETDSPLLVEAGTGTGKSLAYLLPAILHSVREERPAVISSHTIALQEQLESKDIPLCRQILKADPELHKWSDFRHALLVGKGNYICGSRLSQAIETKAELFPSAQQKELERLSDWYQQTRHGMLQELSPPVSPEVWEWVNADGAACNNRNCSPETCFYRKARAALHKANLIIVNHSLLFSLLASGFFPRNQTPGVLLPLDFLILDEAHTIPSIATDHLGLYLSEYGLRRQLLRLYNPNRKQGRGLLVRHGNAGLLRETETLLQRAEQFFNNVRSTFLAQKDTFRPREPHWVENALDEGLASLAHGISRVEARMPEGPPRDELEGLRKSLQTYRDGFVQCLSISDPESVYWAERGSGKARTVRFRSAPLDLAPVLRERLFNRNTSVVLTSATLAEGPDMQSYQTRIGAEEVDCLVEQSPFDYPMQMQICIARDAPAPNIRNQRLDQDYLENQLRFCIKQVAGGTLVLFTSYQDLYRLERSLRGPVEEEGRCLLVQGIDGSRSELVRKMKASGNAVLFGTDSFWTGVDIPGPALQQIVIIRLPFKNPDHPILEARSERCRQRGGNPFSEITLPSALVKFRQGIGRLIRNQTDSGIVNLLDARILHKPYGKTFLESLPHDQVILYTLQNREELFPRI
jgi:ATP-dependent DNA helicase DinG